MDMCDELLISSLRLIQLVWLAESGWGGWEMQDRGVENEYVQDMDRKPNANRVHYVEQIMT
jgi:hypothetical protein